MRIVVDINHPAHVHYFKYFIREMKDKGHEILITASQKDVTFKLLEGYHLEFVNAGSYGKSVMDKIVNTPIMDMKYYLLVKRFRPDILIGAGSIRAAHASYILRKPCINFEDTEHSTEQIRLYMPFVKLVCTPSCYSKNLGKKHVRFNSYLELASLHPNRFMVDQGVLDELNLKEGESLIVIRFVSWGASHDVGHHGIRDKVRMVEELEKYGRVIITSEGQLPEELKKFQISVSPEKIHDIMSCAALYIGEGATMASESALLGTPSIYVSSLAGTMGNLTELENKYDILYGFVEEGEALKKAIEILKDPQGKSRWMAAKDHMAGEKIDLTEFMIWLVDKYPNSYSELMEHPDLWNGSGPEIVDARSP
jgi:uncharacterized protein